MNRSANLSISYSVRRDSDLWSRLKEGDRSALDAIYYGHIKALMNYGRQFVLDSTTIDDCIQDLFLHIWLKRSSLSDVTSIRFYLIKSLKRRIIRTEKKVKSFVQVSEFFPDVNVLHFSQDTSNDETISNLKFCIQDLSALQREIIYLKYYNGLSFDEIGEILELTKKQLYNATAKAMAKLRGLLTT